TAMGGRMLKLWLKKPLLEKEEVVLRHDGVNVLIENYKEQEKLRSILEKVADIERILSRLSVNIGNARDLINLKLSLGEILEVKYWLSDYSRNEVKSLKSNNVRIVKIFESLEKQITSDIGKVILLIEENIVSEPPIDTKSGGIIKKGIHKELDK